MLAAMRKSWLLFALFALFAVSSALDVDGIHNFLHRGKRQVASGTGRSAATTSDDNKSSAAPSSNPPRTSNAPATSAQPSSNAAPSQTPASSNAQPTQSSEAPKSSGAAVTSNAPSSSQEVFTSALVSTSVQLFTTVIVTESNGQQVSITSTGASTNVVTTGQATITGKPSTNSGSDSGHGLSTSSKNIIGGVVGGVGGAILLGGIALVCWRIWGRKKRVSEDDDDLMAGTGSALGDKPHGSGNSNTPFQSNLEQYHNPGGRPNAAANF